jgi:tetratricopeptide (TPR) repeat protein
VNARDPFDWTPIHTAFLAGDYPLCRRLLADAPKPQADLWLGKIDYRLVRLDETIHRLLNLSTGDPHLRAERDSWLAAAYASSGELSLAHQLIDRALEVLAPPDEAYYRALYVSAMALYFEQNYEAALDVVTPMFESPNPLDRGLAYNHRSWIHARAENLQGQVHDLLLSLDEFEKVDQPDEYTLAHTLVSLTAMCRELSTQGVYERVRDAMPRIHDTEGNALSNFLLQRHMGLIEALYGNELSAMRRWRIAEASAPTDYWRVFCLVDRASLAATMGRAQTSRKALEKADKLASNLNWSSTSDSERIILLTIAQLYAEDDPARTQRYLAAFRSLSTQMNPRIVWVGDRRTRALQLYPHAVALLRMGERDAALPMLEEAHDIFIAFEHGWRAALAALELYKATSESRWLERAQAEIAPWPQSWIAREVRNAR